jgi:hypothetical protein
MRPPSIALRTGTRSKSHRDVLGRDALAGDDAVAFERARVSA